MTTLGIDPGLSGALAFIDGSSVRTYDMPVLRLARGGKQKNEPDFLELTRIIRDIEGVPSVAFVEQVGAMPGQGVSSMFAFGKTYGGILGVLAALGVRTELVAPPTWKRFHRIQKDSGKDVSRALAKNLFPQQAGHFARVKDDGRADATLIAWWGLHQTMESQFPRAADGRPARALHLASPAGQDSNSTKVSQNG